MSTIKILIEKLSEGDSDKYPPVKLYREILYFVKRALRHDRVDKTRRLIGNKTTGELIVLLNKISS